MVSAWATASSAALRAAAAALVFLLQLGRVALVDDQAVVVEQLFAGLEIAQGLDEDTALFFVGLAVGLAGVVDPARGIAADLGVDDVAAVVQAEVEGVVGVGGVVRMAAQRLGPGDDLAGVFDDAFARGDGLERKHALAMHAALAHLDAARIAACGGGSCGSGRLAVSCSLGTLKSYERACVRARTADCRHGPQGIRANRRAPRAQKET
jgi:hypothetical protein